MVQVSDLRRVRDRFHSNPDGGVREVTVGEGTNVDRMERPRRHVMPREVPSGGGMMGRLDEAGPAVTAAVLGATGLAMLTGVAAATAAANATELVVQPRAEAQARYRNIVYVGMNEGAKHEVEGLRARVGNAGVKFIESAKEQDTIVHGNVKHDLSTEEGRTAFVAALGLTGDRAAALESLLEDQGTMGRDELAQLSVVFDQAERGERYIERIVFSGHSVGSGVWGDSNGSLSWTTVGKLSMVFPQAAGQVQDLMIAACYSGGENTMDTYRSMFPNLKTIWAYDGSAPGSVSGAVPHILRWERGTRGTSTDALTRNAAKDTRKGEYVAVWTLTKGYDNGQPATDIATARAGYESTRGVVAEFVSGAQQADNPQTGPLREHYNNIQRMLSRNDLPTSERDALQKERDQVIRLLYFNNVKSFFSSVHAPTITQGFTELGLPVPNFATMSRAEILATIESFDAKLAETTSPSTTLQHLSTLLHDGLRDLSTSHVPEAWI